MAKWALGHFRGQKLVKNDRTQFGPIQPYMASDTRNKYCKHVFERIEPSPGPVQALSFLHFAHTIIVFLTKNLVFFFFFFFFFSIIVFCLSGTFYSPGTNTGPTSPGPFQVPMTPVCGHKSRTGSDLGPSLCHGPEIVWLPDPPPLRRAHFAGPKLRFSVSNDPVHYEASFCNPISSFRFTKYQVQTPSISGVIRVLRFPIFVFACGKHLPSNRFLADFQES